MLVDPFIFCLLALSGIARASRTASRDNISECIINCVVQSGFSDGCTDFTNLQCICTNVAFLQSALSCVQSDCSTEDVQNTFTLFAAECGSFASSETGLPGGISTEASSQAGVTATTSVIVWTTAPASSPPLQEPSPTDLSGAPSLQPPTPSSKSEILSSTPETSASHSASSSGDNKYSESIASPLPPSSGTKPMASASISSITPATALPAPSNASLSEGSIPSSTSRSGAGSVVMAGWSTSHSLAGLQILCAFAGAGFVLPWLE